MSAVVAATSRLIVYLQNAIKPSMLSVRQHKKKVAELPSREDTTSALEQIQDGLVDVLST